MNVAPQVTIRTPDVPKPEAFMDAKEAVVRLQDLYQTAVSFLSENFSAALMNGQPETRVTGSGAMAIEWVVCTAADTHRKPPDHPQRAAAPSEPGCPRGSVLSSGMDEQERRTGTRRKQKKQNEDVAVFVHGVPFH